MTKGLSLFEKRRRRNRTALRARGGGRPRLSVHRSGKHIYAQVIDDENGKTVASASTLEQGVRDKSGDRKSTRLNSSQTGALPISSPRRSVV